MVYRKSDQSDGLKKIVLRREAKETLMTLLKQKEKQTPKTKKKKK
jgi:hypothetical protein